MVYQPQFDIHTKELVGVEALLRWNHKGRFISPGIFIQIAESIGYIRHISEWVCKKVIHDYMKWKDLLPAGFMVGINISPLNLNSDDFSDFFLNIVKESDYEYSFFDCEITEYVELSNAPDLLLRLRRLSDSGVHLSVDDFGTGYSSISYICLYNINRLKISKELVDNMVENEDSKAIVKAIIDMSKSLGVKTIAEGVEYESQLKELKKLGCDQIQGYIWSKPLPLKELEDNYIRKLCSVFDEKYV